MIKEQNAFLADVARLIQWLQAKGFIVTGGELYRPQVTQDYYFAKGCSHAATGNHQRRLAIDLNIFEADGHPADDTIIGAAGAYWESLFPDNRWGGSFKTLRDFDHFERNIGDGHVIPGGADSAAHS